MVKPTHKNWTEFVQIRDATEKIVAAKCELCSKVLKKRDSDTLDRHKKVCKGPSTSSTSMESNLPNQENEENEMRETANICGTKSTRLSTTSDKEVNMPKENSSIGLSTTSDKQNVSKDSIDITNKEIQLLNFFLVNGLDFEIVNSVQCQNFLRAFDPLYTVPSATNMTTYILKHAYEEMLKTNVLQDYLNFLSLLTHETDDKICAIALIMNKKREYVYIDFCTIEKNDSTQQKLQDFSDLLVKKVKELYQLQIKYLIYDGSQRLRYIGEIEDIVYYRINCLSVLLQYLRSNHEPFLVGGEQDIKKLAEYYKKIDNLKQKFIMPDCTLANATEEILKLVEEDTLNVNTTVRRNILQFLNGVLLASNFLCYKYMGHYFLPFQSLSDIMTGFLETALPDDAFTGIADYRNKSGLFKRLFESNHYDPNRFWHISAMEYKSLSSFALQILQLPAITKKLNISVFKILSESSKEKCDMSKALYLSLIINQN